MGAVIWGAAANGIRAHAFVESPHFPWRSYKPRARCGTAWSGERVPTPSDLPRCRTCTRLTKETK